MSVSIMQIWTSDKERKCRISHSVLDPLKSSVRLRSKIESPSLDKTESNRSTYLLCYKKEFLSRFGMIRTVYNDTVFTKSLSCPLIGRRNLMEMDGVKAAVCRCVYKSSEALRPNLPSNAEDMSVRA